MDDLVPVAGTGPSGDELLTWSADAHVLGPPKVVGDVILDYVSAGNSSLALTAWSASDGSVLWTIPASPGAGAAGVELEPGTVTVGNRTFAAVDTDAPAGGHTITVVDIATGVPVEYHNSATTGQTFRFIAGGRPDKCSDADPGAFCVVGGVGPDVTQMRTFRLDPVQAVITGDAESIPANARPLSGGLWATNDRPPAGQEVLGRSENGATVWSHPYDELFGPGYSSDSGWNWQEDPKNTQIIGSVAAHQKGQSTWDVAAQSTVALDAATGAVRWRVDGVAPACQVAGGYSVDLWCRATGTATAADGAPMTPAGPFAVSLEKFDPATGSVVWSAPLGDAPGAIFSSMGTAYAGNDQYRMVGSAGTIVRIRLSDGSITPVGPDEIVGCLATTEYQYHEGGIPSLAEITYPGLDVVQLCHVDGTPAGGSEVTTRLLQVVGTPVHAGLVVLATPAGLRAYRVP